MVSTAALLLLLTQAGSSRRCSLRRRPLMLGPRTLLLAPARAAGPAELAERCVWLGAWLVLRQISGGSSISGSPAQILHLSSVLQRLSSRSGENESGGYTNKALAPGPTDLRRAQEGRLLRPSAVSPRCFDDVVRLAHKKSAEKAKRNVKGVWPS